MLTLMKLGMMDFGRSDLTLVKAANGMISLLIEW